MWISKLSHLPHSPLPPPLIYFPDLFWENMWCRYSIPQARYPSCQPKSQTRASKHGRELAQSTNPNHIDHQLASVSVSTNQLPRRPLFMPALWDQYQHSTSFLARYVIYTAHAYAMMPVRLSVRLSVTEVHWHIIANLGFKFQSHFTAHWPLCCWRSPCCLRANHLAPC